MSGKRKQKIYRGVMRWIHPSVRTPYRDMSARQKVKVYNRIFRCVRSKITGLTNLADYLQHRIIGYGRQKNFITSSEHRKWFEDNRLINFLAKKCPAIATQLAMLSLDEVTHHSEDFEERFTNMLSLKNHIQCVHEQLHGLKTYLCSSSSEVETDSDSSDAASAILVLLKKDNVKRPEVPMVIDDPPDTDSEDESDGHDGDDESSDK